MRVLIFLIFLFFSAVGKAESFESNCGAAKCAVYGIDVSAVPVELLDRDENGRRFRNADGVARWGSANNKKLIFASNAGIFDQAFRPLGLFVSAGKQIVPINTSTGEGNFFAKPNGVFYIQNNAAHIVETSRYKAISDVSIATQSGPLLLQDGIINANFGSESKNKKIRSGVGVQNEHKVYFAISNGEINFFDFASFFKDNLKCSDALYLDGVISKAFIPEIGRFQKDGDFAALFAVFETQQNN